METVLDASAILAFLLEEPGQDRVAAAIAAGACIGAPNLAEVLSVLIRGGMTVADAQAVIADLPVTCIDADLDIAQRAGEMFDQTRAAGVSLGDRLCLALGAREGRPVLAADRVWLTVAADLGMVVTLIR